MNQQARLMNPEAIDRYVGVTAGLYKKAHDPERAAGVTERVRDYAKNILPGLMISRRDPVVLATQEENFD